MLPRSRPAAVVRIGLAGEAARATFAAAVRAYGGLAYEERGGTTLGEFGRVPDAVCAALAFQQENAAHVQAGDGPAPGAGVALGEVVVGADEALTGAGVVLAGRLEPLAPPGGVVVQGAVRDALPARLPCDCRDLGEQSLDGFDEPVRAFEVTLYPGIAAPPPEPRRGRDEASPVGLYARSSRRETYLVLAILLLAGALSVWRANRPEPATAPAAKEAPADAPAGGQGAREP